MNQINEENVSTFTLKLAKKMRVTKESYFSFDDQGRDYDMFKGFWLILSGFKGNGVDASDKD